MVEMEQRYKNETKTARNDIIPGKDDERIMILEQANGMRLVSITVWNKIERARYVAHGENR